MIYGYECGIIRPTQKRWEIQGLLFSPQSSYEKFNLILSLDLQKWLSRRCISLSSFTQPVNL